MIITKIKVNVAIRNEKKNVRSVIARTNKASIQLNIIAKNPEIIAPARTNISAPKMTIPVSTIMCFPQR